MCLLLPDIDNFVQTTCVQKPSNILVNENCDLKVDFSFISSLYVIFSYTPHVCFRSAILAWLGFKTPK
jgi:hypothetical protein